MQEREIQKKLDEMWDAVHSIPSDDPGKRDSVMKAARIQAKMWDDYHREITREYLRGMLNAVLPIEFDGLDQIEKARTLRDALQLLEQ